MNEPTFEILFLWGGILAGIPAALAVLISIAVRRGPRMAVLVGAIGYAIFRLMAPRAFASLIESDVDQKFFNGVYVGVGLSAVAAALAVIGMRRVRPGSNQALLTVIAVVASLAVMAVAVVATAKTTLG